MQLQQCLQERTDTADDSRPMLDGRWPLTPRDGLTRACKVAAFLEQRGLRASDVIVIGIRDEAEVAVLFLGCLMTGVVPVFVDPNSTLSEVESLLHCVAPSLLLAEPDLCKKWELSRLAKAPVLPASWPKKSLISRWKKAASSEADASTYPACLKHAPDRPSSRRDPQASDRAVILCTSGTTAGPKLVPLTRGNLVAQAKTMSHQLRIGPDSRVLNLMPITHYDGLITGLMVTIWSHATLLRLEPFTVARLPEIMDAVYKYRATHAAVVPTLISLMIRLGEPAREAFGQPEFQYMISLADSIAEDLWRQFEELVGKPLINVYGMSEIGNLLFAGPDDSSHQRGTLGKPIDCQTLIVDGDDRPVAAGESGELLVMAASVMPGYLGQDTPLRAIDGENWFPTGDLVRQNQDGTITMVGRQKDLIITGGNNVAPDAVNHALLSHPSVVEAATLGLADEIWGERIVSCVVTNAEVAPAALQDHVAERLVNFKVPRKVIRLAEFPKNRVGKVILSELRELIQSGQEPELNTNETLDAANMEKTILDLASRVLRTPRNTLTLASGPDQCMGWDSMAHLDFVLQLEQTFHVTIPPRDVMRIRTLQSALDIVQSKIRSGGA